MSHFFGEERDARRRPPPPPPPPTPVYTPPPRYTPPPPAPTPPPRFTGITNADIVSPTSTTPTFGALRGASFDPNYNLDRLGDPFIGEVMDVVQGAGIGLFGDPVAIGEGVAREYLGIDDRGNIIGGAGGFGGGGGGGFGAAAAQQIKPASEVKWKEGNFTLETPAGGSAPDWWKPLIPADSKDMERPDIAYASMLNTMIPYMSPEDQRRAAGDIYALLGGANFGKYQEVSGDPNIPITQLQSSLGLEGQVIDSQYFQSRQRSTGAINALSQLREQTVGGNREKIGGTGSGYRWLQTALEQAISYGGGPSRKQEGTEGASPGQSRAQYLAFQGAIDPIMAQASSMGPVGSIGQMLLQPFFSQGGVRPTQRTQSGSTIFGTPNAILFG